MLETWNLVRKHTHIFSFRKYAFSTKTLLIIAGVSIFLKNSAFFGKNITFTHESMKAVLKMF